MFSGTKGYRTKPPVGVRLNPLHPLSQGLVGYWLFNEGSGSSANDISGHGNHGMLMNMAPNAQGSGWGGSEFGGGLEFDRGGDYVRCVGGFESIYNNNALTFSLWVKISDQSVDQRIGGRYGLIVPDRSFLLWMDIGAGGVGYASLIVTEGGVNLKLGENVGSLILNQWQLVTMTWDGVTSVLYVDGNAIDSTSGAYQIQAANAQHVEFGAYKDFSDVFGGSMDSVRIYDRALSAAEVKKLYHDPFCNLLRVPVRYAPVAPGGLPIPVAMNYYRRRRVA